MRIGKSSRFRTVSGLAATVVLATGFAAIAHSAGEPLVSVLDLMEKTITPASNTIWGAYDPPQTDQDWQAIEEAAVTMLVAAQANAIGGTGPMDEQWASEATWQAFNQVMINASRDALAAARARDHEALLAAGDVLYPPCEGCHQQFNPGVVNADQ